MVREHVGIYRSDRMIIVNEKNNTEYNFEEPSTTKKLIKVHLKNGLIFLMVFCKLVGMVHEAWCMGHGAWSKEYGEGICICKYVN